MDKRHNQEEYGMSLLKHAARLKIDFGAPVFSWMHLEEFEGRLSLANAENTYRAVTGYSATTIRTWLAQDRNVWIVECENIPDPEMLGNHSVATVSLERLGEPFLYRMVWRLVCEEPFSGAW